PGRRAAGGVAAAGHAPVPVWLCPGAGRGAFLALPHWRRSLRNPGLLRLVPHLVGADHHHRLDMGPGAAPVGGVAPGTAEARGTAEASADGEVRRAPRA